MVKIRQDLVPSSIGGKVTYSGVNPCNYIVIHETANEGATADAAAHGRLQKNGNNRDASWQYTVDDKEAVQSFKDEAQCWAAGNAFYNKNGINIEICVNAGGNYKKAVQNTAELVKILMARHNIPKGNVITHRVASGWKDCPHYLRSGSKGVDWDDFLKMIDGSKPAKPTPQPSAKPKPTPVAGKPDFDTKSIVDFLISVGVDHSFANRAKLAAAHGIKGYDGDADENEKLLDMLKKEYKSSPVKKDPKPAPTPKPTPKGDMKTNSIVEYLNSINVDSSMANRKKLAAQNGIKNYSGSEEQNLKLLNILRGKATASKPAAPTKPKPKGDMKTTSVVDYLKSINKDSSMTNRKKLAAQYGIKNYSGTPKQNELLLKKLRG